MRQTLDKRFATFLRKRRGDLSYAEFAKKVGLQKSSVYRFEMEEQSASLRTVQQVLDRLKCSHEDLLAE